MTADLRKEMLTGWVLENIPALHRFAYSLCQNNARAEELVSETVVKAFEKRQQLKDENKIKQWLFRILNNLFISHYRQAKKLKRAALPADGAGFSLYEQVAASNFTDNGTPEKSFISKITKEKIREAINALPEAFRSALVLCDVEEFSYAEIAAITKVPVGTVRSRIARARGLLQKKLWIYAGELGIRRKQKEQEYVCTCGMERLINEQRHEKEKNTGY